MKRSRWLLPGYLMPSDQKVSPESARLLQRTATRLEGNTVLGQLGFHYYRVGNRLGGIGLEDVIGPHA